MKLVLDGFEAAALSFMLPAACRRTQIGYHEMKWVATAPEDLKGVCFFPFHTHASMEAKLFKPARVTHTVAFPLRENPSALMWLTRATSGPVVVDGESFLDALFASAGQG